MSLVLALLLGSGVSQAHVAFIALVYKLDWTVSSLFHTWSGEKLPLVSIKYELSAYNIV